MRPGQQNKRGRGRGNNNNNNRKNSNPLSRSYDSSGPDVKIRGTAQHIAEKYGQLARDAQSSGDTVMAENYLQHAEHYNRIIFAAQAQMQERYQRDERENTPEPDAQQPQQAAQADASSASNGAQPAAVEDGSGPQPVLDGVPAEMAMADQPTGEAEPRPSGRSATRRPRRPRAPKKDDAAAPADAKDVPSEPVEASAPAVAAASD